MDIAKLLELLVAVEQDPEVKPTTYLTDGDEDTFPATLKALVEFCNAYYIDRQDGAAIEASGYDVVYAECLCIMTSKGLVNTGSDCF